MFVIVIIHFSLFQSLVAWQETFKYVNITNCGNKEYFDRNLLQCVVCDSSKHLLPSIGGGSSCQCMKKSRIVYTANNGTVQCELCQANETISTDQTVCIQRKCVQRSKGPPACQLCGQNQITLTHNINGSLLKQVQCITCRSNTLPSPDKTQCVPCSLLSLDQPHVRLCSCDSSRQKEVNGVCLPKDFLLSREEYKPASNEWVWDAGRMMAELLVSEYLCMKGNATSCQKLANLCVMTLYDAQASSPCRLWKATTLPSGLPWLMYSENEAYAILNQKSLNAEYSYKSAGKNKYIRVVAAVYSYDAAHFRIEDSIAKWSLLCPCTNTLPLEHFKFGINYRHKCTVSARYLLQGEQSFFVPYLKYASDAAGKEQKLHALPVSIKYKGHELKSNDAKNVLLFRRFFLLQKCGQSSNNKTCKGDIVARYLKSFTLKIKIESNKHGKYSGILTPLLQLEYDTLRMSHIQHDTHFTLNFAVDNEIPGLSLLYDIEISIGVLCGVAILLSLGAAWSRYRVRATSPVTTFVTTLVIHCCGHFANAFYVVWWGVCLHGLVIVKGQSLLYRLPPTPKEEQLLQSFIMVAFAFKTIEMLWVNWQQINIDIFFLYWEKPHDKTQASSSREGNFRRSTIAGRWLQLQTVRRVSPLLLTAICLLLLEIGNLMNLCDVESSEPSLVRNSKCHALALSATCWVLTWVALYSAKCAVTTLQRHRGDLWIQFDRFCSLANVSVFVFESDLYGYYLHGRSVGNEFSTNKPCGLTPNSTHTNFIMCVSRPFRSLFRKLMAPMMSYNSKGQVPPTSNAASTTHLTPNCDGSEWINTSGASTIEGLGSYKEPRVQLHNTLTKFLSSFIDHALEEYEYRIRSRGLLERVLGCELGAGADETPGVTQLLHDPQPRIAHHYTNVLWWGQEWTLATFDLCLFSFVHCVSGSVLVAVFVGVAVWKVNIFFAYWFTFAVCQARDEQTTCWQEELDEEDID